MSLLTNPSSSLKNIIEKYSIVSIYVFVNCLFIIKYGEDYNVFLLVCYIAVLGILAMAYGKFELNNSFYRGAFWVLVGLFFVFTIAVNYYVDGNYLNVDRWSAMEVGIKAVFNNEYPYNIPDHMGRTSSNLPVLMVLGMPFYFVFGSVGFLQSFGFLLFSYLIYKIFVDYRLRLAALVLLMLSPSYLWEVYTKSDLFTNFIIVAGFVFLIWHQFISKKKMKTEWAAFLTALVVLTRISAAIPVVIILFKKVSHFSWAERLRFVSVFLATTVSIIYVFFHNAPSLDIILKYNPLTIQGGKQPLLLSVSYLVVSSILSFRTTSFFSVAFWSGIMLFICVVVSFLMNLGEYGYENMIINSFFDLSFFNMAMPFIIVSFVLVLRKNYHKNTI